MSIKLCISQKPGDPMLHNIFSYEDGKQKSSPPMFDVGD